MLLFFAFKDDEASPALTLDTGYDSYGLGVPFRRDMVVTTLERLSQVAEKLDSAA